MRKLMLGNEAIARGVYEAGVTVAIAYPGTPSTEITEQIAKYEEVYAEWAPNEKVALEVAIGASLGGARAVASTKHVGLNVAADPLFTVAYTGIEGGLVLFVADDPGMHSSQNEQDTRLIARAANVPLLEPADSQECKDYVSQAMAISEAYDTPVIVRLTTRISHSQSIVTLKEREKYELKDYKQNISKYVMVPGNARARHVVVEKRINQLQQDSPQMGLHQIEESMSNIGVITSGICYQYVKESGIEAKILKLGMLNPLPLEIIRDFASQVDTLYIVEELEPFIEEQVKAMGIKALGKALFGKQGEITVKKLREVFNKTSYQSKTPASLPVRPPVLCPGCPHRSLFTVLNKLKLAVMGDIGCYTLGAMAPHVSMDTCICMGASVGMTHGLEKARGRAFAKQAVGVIGDSTFLHSGITGLMDVVYNKGVSTLIIADNSTTGMTGHQQHPATGKTLKGEEAHCIDLVQLCHAIGVKSVRVVDAYDLKAVEKTIKEELVKEEPSVIITKAPCRLLIKESWPVRSIQHEKCIQCKACLKLGCPALQSNNQTFCINDALCAGCGVCETVCKVGAIGKGGIERE